MENEMTAEVLDTSFDLVARQDAAEQALGALRSDVEEVKSRLERASRSVVRPAIGGGAVASAELKGFVDGYLRQGNESQLKSQMKSMSVGSPTDGGYDVPMELDQKIAVRLIPLSPIRSIAQVVQVGSSGYRKLITLNGTASGWVSETSARPGTATPQFAQIAPPYGDLYANPSASQQMIDDAAFNLETWLTEQISREFARAEGAAFVSGTGVGQPLGFLGAPTSTANDTVRTFGTLQYIGSGNASGFDTSPELHLVDMVMALKMGHRQGATWVMNANTLATVRKFKDAEGAFMWQPGLVAGTPDRLLGYPVVEAADMPDVAAGAFPIAFGNFQNGYIITERNTTRILRDPYTNQPFVNFYATKRLGGQVLDSEAIKLMKISA